MISNAQEFQSYFVEHDGMRHHVRCAGDGPATLIINGGPGMNSNGFEGLAAQFTATHTVYLYDDSFRQQIARRLGQARMHINAQVWRDLAAKGYDVTEKMRSFDKLVLLIQGDTDVLNSSIAQRSAEVLPNAQLVFVPRSAHYGWIENPEEYLGTVKEYLASL